MNEVADQGTERRTLASFVGAKVSELSRLYLSNNSAGVQAVARLASAAAKHPGNSLEVMRWTLDGLPASFDSRDGDASWEENATHASITLYALHQRSNRTSSVHRPDVRFGTAVRALEQASANKDGVLRRFNAVGTAAGWDELSTHLRGLVNMFRSSNIVLDYGLLARDLVDFQNQDRRDAVRLRWGREFYRTTAVS